MMKTKHFLYFLSLFFLVVFQFLKRGEKESVVICSRELFQNLSYLLQETRKNFIQHGLAGDRTGNFLTKVNAFTATPPVSVNVLLSRYMKSLNQNLSTQNIQQLFLLIRKKVDSVSDCYSRDLGSNPGTDNPVCGLP